MNNKPYKPTPHPMQHRVEQFRVIPSLVTGGKREPSSQVEPIPFMGMVTLEASK